MCERSPTEARLLRILIVSSALVLGLAALPAWAQKRPLQVYPDEKSAPDWYSSAERYRLGQEESSAFDDFVVFVDRKIQRAVELDLYGSTAQLPEGILGIKYTFRYIGADERFLGDGSRDDLIPTISFSDDTGTELVGLSLNGEGSGTVHLFQISAGLTDDVDMFLELNWSDITTEFKDPSASFGGPLAALGFQDYEDLVTLIELLGRPRPNEKFATDGLEFGDVQVGFSWNWFRGPEWSFSSVASVFLPTGKVADPNNDINFALGPELDRGNGGWATLFVNNVDYRPPIFDKRVVFSAELDWTHIFAYDRKSPTAFTTPNPVVAGLLDLVGFDSDIFPDLTDVPATYEWDPGEGIEALIGFSVDAEYATLAMQYGYSYSQAVEITSESAEFVQLIEALELTGETSAHALSFTVAPNTLKLGLPFLVAFIYEFPFAGKNTIIFDPAIRVVTQFFLPLW